MTHLVSPTRSWARWQGPTSASSMPATASDGWGAIWSSDRDCSAFKPGHIETFGFVVPWTQHVRKGREFLFRGFDLASRIGEISYAGYACGQLNTNYLMAGDPLIEAQEQAEHGLAFARKVGFGAIEGWILGQLGLIRSLRGLTTRLGSFDDACVP